MFFSDKVTAMYSCNVWKSFPLLEIILLAIWWRAYFFEGLRTVVIFCYDHSFCWAIVSICLLKNPHMCCWKELSMPTTFFQQRHLNKAHKFLINGPCSYFCNDDAQNVAKLSLWKAKTWRSEVTNLFFSHCACSMILIVHPIENELQDPTQMKSIVRTSITLCLIVYVATSFFGFLLFGNHTMDDVLANFDADLGIPYSSLINDVVRVSYCIHLMLVFPMVFFSLRLNLDGLLFPYAIPIAYDNQRFFSVTAALMGFIFLGANYVPSIWDAFQFTGATATVCIGFIFPAAVALRWVYGLYLYYIRGA